MSVFNCGIINGFREIYNSESHSQALLFLLNLCGKAEQPEYIGYDTACVIAKMLDNNTHITDPESKRLKTLKEKKIFVDRFHFNKHSYGDTYCRNYCDPDKYPSMKDINTECAEQTNLWFSGKKILFKYLNRSRHKFITYIMCSEYNQFKIKNNLAEEENGTLGT